MTHSDQLTAPSLDHAVAEFQAGQSDAAVASLRDILESEPQHDQAWHVLGLVWAQTGNPEDAARALKQATIVAPFQPEYYADLGKIYLSAGESDKAQDCFWSAFILGAADEELAQLLSKTGATAIEPASLVTVAALDTLNSLISDGQSYRAVQVGTGLLDTHPLDPRLSYCLALANQSLNDVTAVVEHLQIVADGLPAFAGAQKGLADFLWVSVRLQLITDEFGAGYNGSKGQTMPVEIEAQVEGLYRHALKHDDRNWETHTYLANFLRSIDRSDEALEHYRTAADLAPENQMALFNLSSILTARGEVVKAREIATGLIETYPEFGEAQNLLGKLLATQNDIEAAGGRYLQALRLEPIPSTEIYT